MYFLNKKSLFLLSDLISVILGFHVYILDDEVTSDQSKRDLNATHIAEVHHLEPGEVSQELFRYENHQNANLDSASERCYHDLNRCLLSSTSNSRPVCAYNKLKTTESTSYCADNRDLRYCHKRSFRSYCDAFFDNCRRGYRYWVILGLGHCVYGREKEPKGYWGKDLFDVHDT